MKEKISRAILNADKSMKKILVGGLIVLPLLRGLFYGYQWR